MRLVKTRGGKHLYLDTNTLDVNGRCFCLDYETKKYVVERYDGLEVLSPEFLRVARVKDGLVYVTDTFFYKLERVMMCEDSKVVVLHGFDESMKSVKLYSSSIEEFLL